MIMVLTWFGAGLGALLTDRASVLGAVGLLVANGSATCATSEAPSGEVSGPHEPPISPCLSRYPPCRPGSASCAAGHGASRSSRRRLPAPPWLSRWVPGTSPVVVVFGEGTSAAVLEMDCSARLERKNNPAVRQFCLRR